MTLKEYNKAVKLLSDRLYTFCLKNIGNQEDAKDIVQHCYEQLWINKEKIAYEKAKSYLYQTAYNYIIDLVRKKKVRDNYIYNHPHKNFYEMSEEVDLAENIDYALSQLTDIQRTVLLMRDLENYTYNEIAEITGLSNSQVKVYIYRARMSIKKFFEKLEKVKK